MVIDYRQREEHLAAPSDIRQVYFNSPIGISATTGGSCETTNLELQPVVVSEILNAKEEMQAYMRLTGSGWVSEGESLFLFVFLAHLAKGHVSFCHG